ncbi:MAG TPA: hypothetical protein VMS65_06430 [Polyangiaceae bacterium]|nr:hypothetical protein [Polyangiaceae bacterium]
MTKSAIGLVFLSCVFLPACGDDEADSIEINGEWASDFMSTEVISDDSWTVDYGDGPASSEIVEFSNLDNSAVLLAADGTYGLTVWTEISDDSFYYCGVSFGEATADDAANNAQNHDDTDPANGGCGDLDFSWTKLTKQ